SPVPHLSSEGIQSRGAERRIRPLGQFARGRLNAAELTDVEDALASLLGEQLLELLPDRLRARRRRRQDRFVAVVRLAVLLDEVADVDLGLPQPGSKALPGGNRSFLF